MNKLPLSSVPACDEGRQAEQSSIVNLQFCFSSCRFQACLPVTKADRQSIFNRQSSIINPLDLVVEILSPKDTPADTVALEADYQSIGAAEIWIIDQKRKHVRVLRKQGERYQEEVISKGVLRSEVVEGFWLKVEWLFAKPLPLKLDTLTQVLGG